MRDFHINGCRKLNKEIEKRQHNNSMVTDSNVVEIDEMLDKQFKMKLWK
jgi:hypothetical protein